MCRDFPSGAASAFRLVLWDEQVRDGGECQERDRAELLPGGFLFGRHLAWGCAGQVRKGTGLSAAGQDAAPVTFPGDFGEPYLPWGGLEPGLSLSDYCSWACKQFCHNPACVLAARRVLSWKQCSIPACGAPARGSAGRGPCPAPTAPCHAHRGAHIPGCPSHPCRSVPSAAAAVPGNLSLKSINFSHTPREQRRNPSSLPPWLLSATIWHGLPAPPRPPCL